MTLETGLGEKLKREGMHFGFPGKKKICLQCRRCRRCWFYPWVGKIPWRRAWQLTPVFLPRKSHGQRSLVGCSPCGHKEFDMTEHAHMHFGTCQLRCFFKRTREEHKWRPIENGPYAKCDTGWGTQKPSFSFRCSDLEHLISSFWVSLQIISDAKGSLTDMFWGCHSSSQMLPSC